MRATLRALGVAGLLAAIGLSLSATPTAVADEIITHQPYADLLGIKALHEKDYTGEGVTIAYVEAPRHQHPRASGGQRGSALPGV